MAHFTFDGEVYFEKGICFKFNMDVFMWGTLFIISHILLPAVYFIEVYDLYFETNTIVIAEFHFIYCLCLLC